MISLIEIRTFKMICPAAVVAAALGLGLLAPTAGLAQDNSSIGQQLERLRRDITDLQRTVFAGAEPPAAAVDSLQAQSAEGAQAAARLQLRIQELEREIRTLTGRLEEAGFQINTMTTRLDKLISDVDFRLQALETGAARTTVGQTAPQQVGQPAPGVIGGGTGQIAQGVLPPPATAPATTGSATTVISSQGTVTQGTVPQGTVPQGTTGSNLGAAAQTQVADGGALPTGQQLLGQVSQTNLQASQSGQPVAQSAASPALPAQTAALQPPAPAPAAPTAAPAPAAVQQAAPAQAAATVTLPPGTEKEQYQFAFNLLRSDLAQAEAAFGAFLEQNPNGPFAGNAMYWLGETHYARSNFREAAAVFVDAYTNYPNSPKASASLLKLGMSLGALGKSDAACASFSELKGKYADTDGRVLARADQEAAKIGCP